MDPVGGRRNRSVWMCHGEVPKWWWCKMLRQQWADCEMVWSFRGRRAIIDPPTNCWLFTASTERCSKVQRLILESESFPKYTIDARHEQIYEVADL